MHGNTTDIHTLIVDLPLDALLARCPDFCAGRPGKLGHQLGLGRLALAGMLEVAAALKADAGAPSRAEAGARLAELVASLLMPAPDQRRLPRSRMYVLLQAKAYIERHLDSALLDSDAVAKASGLSAPVYLAALDPGGVYMAWLPLVFATATVAAMLGLVLLDFWPLTLLAGARPRSTRQPWFGIINGALTVLIAICLWRLFVGLGRMDLVRFLVEVCVSLVFGIFIVLVMLDGLPAIRIGQPWRGLALIGIACAFAVGGFALYASLAHGRFALAPGQSGYALEMWIASAMLAVTFPAMVAFAKYFDCWPLARAAPVRHPAAATT